MSAVYKYLVGILFLAILVQIGFAGYGAFSVSASNQDAVTAYIRNQQRHHKRVDFVDEFRGLLEKHGISYDERYLL